MDEVWTEARLLDLATGYQRASVLLAAAELDLFGALQATPRTAGELAEALGCDRRATTILADALTALGLLHKRDGIYQPAAGVAGRLSGPASILPMLRHQANICRSWAQLAAITRSGRPAHEPSIHGSDADREAFIEAMEVASREAAPKVVASLGELRFEHLLDVGGGPGTWTAAFLRAVPGGRATLYDLPDVIPIARRHLESVGLADRVRFVAGDLATDPALPEGADLAWVSAIAHMYSRAQNRELFRKVHSALVPGGRILIRDMVMDDSHTSPPAGALFAINMLVRTEGGGTFSFAEMQADLAAAGFRDAAVQRGERDMDSVVSAVKG
jgi:SAM-dependent methyltransferase